MPIVSQLPVFIGTSWMLSHLSQPPTLFDNESFLTLTSLAHSDPTATLPIVLGLVTLANVESSRWFASAEALQRENRVETLDEDVRADQAVERGMPLAVRHGYLPDGPRTV